MGQGFGQEAKKLGYVLLLLPKGNAYAARLSMPDFQEEPFWGITNNLEMARRWRKQKAVEKSIFDYFSVFEDELEKHGEHTVIIKRLEQSPNGKLSTIVERKVYIEKQSTD